MYAHVLLEMMLELERLATLIAFEFPQQIVAGKMTMVRQCDKCCLHLCVGAGRAHAYTPSHRCLSSM
jgi:predicted metal-binding protein